MSVFNSEFMKNMPHASIRTDKPIFVVGMPRSGTSLVEQIIASHQDAYGAGELRNIIVTAQSLNTILQTDVKYPECIHMLNQDILDAVAQHYIEYINELAPDALRVIDKMPGNFMHLGLIEMLFPDARIIHCQRDPLDNCISCFFQDFSRSHQYSYDLDTLGVYYTRYQRVMEHWGKVLNIPVFNIKYEDLINNQEEKSRELIEFCGLEWDDKCLRFYETKRFVGTASYDQVNKPIYAKSVSRWRHYESYIKPLIEILGA